MKNRHYILGTIFIHTLMAYLFDLGFLRGYDAAKNILLFYICFCGVVSGLCILYCEDDNYLADKRPPGLLKTSVYLCAGWAGVLVAEGAFIAGACLVVNALHGILILAIKSQAERS